MATGTLDVAAQLEELRALLKAKEQPDERQVSSGFNLKIGGHDYTVRDGVEAQRLVDQYESNRTEEFERQRIELERQRQDYESNVPQQTQQATADNFDKNEYARLFLNDPRQAQKYLIQHDPEQIAFYKAIADQIASVRQDAVAAQQDADAKSFVAAHPDYVPTAKNYKAIEGIVNQAGLPWNLNSMNLAFYAAKQGNLLELPAGSRYTDETDEPEVARRTPTPPRVGRRTSAAADDEAAVLEAFERLSPDEMKRQLEKWSPGR